MDILRQQDTEKKFPTPSTTSPGAAPKGSEIMTTLGEDTEFKGDLKFKHSLKIEGSFEGNINTDGSLIVGRTGSVKAEMKVGSLIVEGKVNGNVSAEELIDLRATAEFHGDISASKLKIDEGVIFVGKTDVQPKERRSARPTEEAKPQANQAQKK